MMIDTNVSLHLVYEAGVLLALLHGHHVEATNGRFVELIFVLTFTVEIEATDADQAEQQGVIEEPQIQQLVHRCGGGSAELTMRR